MSRQVRLLFNSRQFLEHLGAGSAGVLACPFLIRAGVGNQAGEDACAPSTNVLDETRCGTGSDVLNVGFARTNSNTSGVMGRFDLYQLRLNVTAGLDSKRTASVKSTSGRRVDR